MTKKIIKKETLDLKLRNKINEIRKILQMDGGDLSVVEFDKNKNNLIIELKGMCSHCPMAEITIKEMIQGELRKDFPKISVQRF